jgi:hypothetical protein
LDAQAAQVAIRSAGDGADAVAVALDEAGAVTVWRVLEVSPGRESAECFLLYYFSFIVFYIILYNNQFYSYYITTGIFIDDATGHLLRTCRSRQKTKKTRKRGLG